jgi:hypothetical protein
VQESFARSGATGHAVLKLKAESAARERKERKEEQESDLCALCVLSRLTLPAEPKIG